MLNKFLKFVAIVSGVAGAVALAPLGLPAAVVAVVTKVAVGGAVVGTAAAKYLPGHGDNAPGVK